MDQDGNYVFMGKVAIPGGNMDNGYTLTMGDWQPIGTISGPPNETMLLMERVDKLERLVKMLAGALGVSEEFLSCAADDDAIAVMSTGSEYPVWIERR